MAKSVFDEPVDAVDAVVIPDEPVLVQHEDPVDPVAPVEATESVEEAPPVKVECDPDFDHEDGLNISVPGYETLELKCGQPVEVSAAHAALLVESPAVKVAE